MFLADSWHKELQTFFVKELIFPNLYTDREM